MKTRLLAALALLSAFLPSPIGAIPAPAGGVGPWVSRPEDGTPPWVGAWRAAERPDVLLRLEPARATLLLGGRLSFFRLRATEDGALELEASARRTLLELAAVSEEGLSLALRADEAALPHGIGRGAADPWSGAYVRLAEAPPELELPTVPIADPFPVDEDVRLELAEELARREVEDQRVRQGQPPFSPAALAEMRAVDEDNVEFLLGILDELGWVDVERFGRDANRAAFLIVQHSGDLGLMGSTLPLIEAEVRAGRADAQYFALLFDRFRLTTGYLQRYGTQLGSTPGGEVVLLPLEDPGGVEARRAELGIFPLAEYLEAFTGQNGGRPIRLLSEALAAPRAPGDGAGGPGS